MVKRAWLLLLLFGAPLVAQDAPLDPLTADEQDRAEAVARRDPRVVELVGRDPRVGSVQFVVPRKPEREDPDRAPDLGRHAAVLLRARSRGAGARVLVDLRAATVVEVKPLRSVDVPLGQEDLEEAWALAQKSPEVVGLLGARYGTYRVRSEGAAVGTVEDEVLGMPVVGTQEGDPCTVNRCLALLFRHGMTFVENVEVLVDLTAGEVRVTRREEARR